MRQLLTIGIGIVAAALLIAQAPSGDSADRLELTATSANVSGAPDQVRFEILRWSTDEEREKLMDAWELKPDPAAAKGAAGGGRGAAKGGAKGAAAAKGGGKGGAGGAKGGRGGGAPAEPLTPEASLTKALEEAATVGYLWTSEVAGYSLRYATRLKNADGTQRIVLATQRRLGETSQKWNLTSSESPNAYEFSVIELRLDSKGQGSGRASLAGTLAPDPATQFLSIQNYDGLPVVFRDVRIAQP